MHRQRDPTATNASFRVSQFQEIGARCQQRFELVVQVPIRLLAVPKLDRFPLPNSYDDATLVQIVYPPGAKGLDIMDVRQGFAKFMNADGQTFGNWKSKANLKEAPLGLDREVKRVQVSREEFDLAAIARGSRHLGVSMWWLTTWSKCLLV